MILLPFAFLFSSAMPVQSQQISQVQEDARALVGFYLQQQALAMPERAQESRILQRAEVYRWAGAEGELREEIQNLTEDHPMGLLHAMVADCWNPAHYEVGLQRAKTWLVKYLQVGGSNHELAQQVQDFLQEADAHRKTIAELRRSSQWIPVLSVLMIGFFLTRVFRWMP